MSHTKDMIEVQYGDRSAILGGFLDFMTNSSMPSKEPKGKRSPRTLCSSWSSSSSESSESHEGDHQSQHKERRIERQHQAWRQSQDNGQHHLSRRQSHDLEPDPFAAEFAAAPRCPNYAMFSKSERRKLQRIETWAQDVEAQTMRQPLLKDRDQAMPRYMTFDTRARLWTFRRPRSDPGSEQSSSFNSMLARFRRRRLHSARSEPIGWWCPRVIVALLVLGLVAVGVYEISQQPYRQDTSRDDPTASQQSGIKGV
ncbi:hypothetical protein DOTSEDRAFT_74449 [Dothistroma septosporum NZE10]|uniref:Uncharacterized protein n=1 Tax=Dothistroma septosporum (strain NZE10 / CBS 128990) TaxID=675120 RepID=N1PHU6_DOTSN|nr:hypothetical protein DOTSEDRAFT_74449 [Dothistroma septosporum NZE10]